MSDCVYVLINPIDNKTFYVGKTNKPRNRLTQHIREAKQGIKNIKKSRLIKSILEKGLKPIIRVVEWCFDSDVIEREKFWIKYYRKISMLVNKSNGGEKGVSKSGEDNGFSVLTKENVIKIIELYQNTNLTKYQLSLLFKVSLGAICGIIDGINWIQITKGKINSNFPKTTKNKFEWLDVGDYEVIKMLLEGKTKKQIHEQSVYGETYIDDLYRLSYAK